MKLDLLSKYRTQLMGVAILWVMFYHSYSIIQSSILLNFIKRIGYGGVDIFILVSGFGVYFSISKDNSIISFYKKRVLRIFPYYFPIVLIITFIAYSMGLWDKSSFFYNLTTLGFWCNIGLTKMYDWYIPALLFLYFITPFYYKFFKLNKNVATITVILAAYIFSYSNVNLFGYLYNFTLRIPLFVIGFWIADFLLYHKNFTFKKYAILSMIICLFIGVFILYYIYTYTSYFEKYGIYQLPFTLITFPLCMILAYMFSLFKPYKFPILAFFGTYSLTLFIFHEKILFICGTFLPTYYVDIVAFLVTILLAYLWQNLVDKIISKFRKTKN